MDCSDRFTIEEFIKLCISGAFTDYDGIGYYGDENSRSHKRIFCCNAKIRKIEETYTYIYWYNM